jgi:hypothetical protein
VRWLEGSEGRAGVLLPLQQMLLVPLRRWNNEVRFRKWMCGLMNRLLDR